MLLRNSRKEYHKGISCEAQGIILVNDEEIKGFSAEGKDIFNYPVEGKVLDLFFNDPVLICSTIKNHVLVIDLSDLKLKKRVF